MGFKDININKYSAVPQELKQCPNWICWKAVPDPRSHSGISKIPINPHTGGNAMSNNPSTWADFDTAFKASKQFSGLGFMFSNTEYFGVDLDDMPEDLQRFRDGGNNNIVSEFVNTLQSYAEYSYSGNGIHIICKGTLPKGGRRKKYEFGGFEMYENGRFFVMTGDYCSEFCEIKDCTESIKGLHEKYIGGGREPKEKPNINSSTNSVNLRTVNEIIQAACNAKNGYNFQSLYSGSISGYASHSEADMAFCNMLAFWTGCDADKMDAVFRQSGLMRDKWDRKQSGSTYGALTIQKAIAGCTKVYSPEYKAESTHSLSIGNNNNDNTENTENVRLYTLDDMGNAKRFTDLFGEEIRYCYIEKKWYYYDGRKWCIDNSGVTERMTDRAVEAMKAEAKVYLQTDSEDMSKAFEKHIKNSRSHKSKTAMRNEAMHHVPILPSQMDRYKMALNTPAGIINLKTGELKPHKSEYYFTKITSCDYSATIQCPQWLKFLDEIFNGDKDLIRYVQKAAGYTLTGSTAEQCAFFLYGTGRNGKSTFIDVLRDIWGDYATNIQPETIMVRNSSNSSANSDIARLKGARLVTSVEPNEGVRINEGLLKQLTGDDTVTARKLYSDEFEFKPEFKLWMATNHKPIIRGTDTGIWRRIHMIPFVVQIPEENVDRKLKYKLKAELPAIFKWCVEGCLLYQQEGLSMPKAVLESVKEYRREMDVISAFIDDRCELTGSIKASVLYAVYAKWAEENNEYCMSSTKFGVEMSKRFEKIKTMNGAFYNGISLIESN